MLNGERYQMAQLSQSAQIFFCFPLILERKGHFAILMETAYWPIKEKASPQLQLSFFLLKKCLKKGKGNLHENSSAPKKTTISKLRK